LGLDRSGLSPGILTKVIYAGATLPSFALASDALSVLGEVDVSAKTVERRAKAIGTARCDERDAETDAYLALPLTERKGTPAGVAAPDLAVVQMDGGRLQVFDRSADGDEAAAEKKSGRFWREDKVGLLVSMTSGRHVADPCPAIPAHFLQPARIERLLREIKANAAAAGDDPSPSDTAVSPHAGGRSAAEYEPPAVGVRTVVATTQDAHRFGEMVAAAAWRRGFYGSGRRAFLGDGSNANWGVWERHFSNFTPVVDFIHALTYVYQGAMAGRSVADGWPSYAAWIAALWAGDVAAVIAGLDARQAEVGEPDESDGESSPRRQVAAALGYVRNQQRRMRYAEYRRDGLPVTSCHVESAIKRVNRRVKGTEKFWSPDGAEAILQLRADLLSETDPLDAFWARRATQATGERRHRRTATEAMAA